MVNCYLCKKPIKVSTEEHYYDEKLKKRYHMKCFAGICRVCDKPVYKKTEHKTIGANVWHTECYKRKHGNGNKRKGRVEKKRENPIGTIDETSWKAMQAARKIAGVPKKGQREFEIDFFEKRPPTFEEDAEENPMLVTPTQEAKIIEAYERVVRGFGSKQDRQLIEDARQKGAILGTGPNVMLKHSKALVGGAVQSIRRNPGVKKDYVIKDEYGRVFGTGRDTEGAAKAKALILGQKYMREMTVVYR